MKPLLLAVLLCLSGTAVAEVLHMCAHKRTGAVRLDDSCRRNERPFMVSGEPGPIGFPSSNKDIYGSWDLVFEKGHDAQNPNSPVQPNITIPPCRVTISETVTSSCGPATSANIHDGTVDVFIDFKSWPWSSYISISFAEISIINGSTKMTGTYIYTLHSSPSIAGTVTATKVSD